MKLKALIFDRDGTLIEHVPYLRNPNEVRLLPGVREALRAARDAGVLLFVHSNQSGVGRGMFGLAEVDACNRRMLELLDLGPAPFARVCVAPEAPDQPAVYRKPSPRFAQEIMRDYGFSSREICYVGDRGSDIEAAHQAGTRGAGVATGLDDLRAEIAALGLTESYPVFHSLSEAVSSLLQPSR